MEDLEKTVWIPDCYYDFVNYCKQIVADIINKRAGRKENKITTEHINDCQNGVGFHVFTVVLYPVVFEGEYFHFHYNRDRRYIDLIIYKPSREHTIPLGNNINF